MATSGISAFNPTFDDIVQDAAGMVGGGPVLAEELDAARRGMNYLLTQVQNKNLLLHKVETTVVAVSTSAVTLDNTILDVNSVVVREDDTDVQMQRLGFEAWAGLTSKSQTGKPTQYWFDRRLSSGVLNVWPVPEATEYELVITMQRTTEDIIRAFNHVDMPRRFMPALLFGLAYWIGLRRLGRVPADRLALLKAEYEANLRDALREDRERVSTFIRLGR